MRNLVGCLAMVLMFTTLARAQGPAFKETLRAKADTRLPAYKPAKALSGELTSIGTDTMENLMKLWIEDFTKLYPRMTIKMEAKGSLTAEPALTEGRADIAPLSRELLPSELEHFRKKFGYDPLIVRVALGSYRTPSMTVALTFFVHVSNPISKLNFAQLDAVYCSTRKRGYKEDIARWGQLGLTGEWANREIHPIGIMPPDGISHYIQLMICKDGDLKSSVRFEKIDHSPGVPSSLN